MEELHLISFLNSIEPGYDSLKLLKSTSSMSWSVLMVCQLNSLDSLKIEIVLKFAKQFSIPGKSLEKTFGKMLKSLELLLLMLFCCFCFKATSS